VVAGNSGYSAALLAPLVKQMVVTEDDAGLLAEMRRNLAVFANVKVVAAGPRQGAAALGPYDAILLDAVAAEVPEELFKQLKKNGKLGAVTLEPDGLPAACVFTRHGQTRFREVLFETMGHLHPALEAKETFVF
jgi:protein-L-isoaspartate(D-aspartate) O-methyltransferase